MGELRATRRLREADGALSFNGALPESPGAAAWALLNQRWGLPSSADVTGASMRLASQRDHPSAGHCEAKYLEAVEAGDGGGGG